MTEVTLPAWETAQGVGAHPAGKYAGRRAGEGKRSMIEECGFPASLQSMAGAPGSLPAAPQAGREG